MPHRLDTVRSLAVGAIAAIASATLLPSRRIFGSSVAGGSMSIVATIKAPQKTVGRIYRWFRALPKGQQSTESFGDSYGCAYHHGHDGRICLGRYGATEPVDAKGNPLRGRTRRLAYRRSVVRMLKEGRHERSAVS